MYKHLFLTGAKGVGKSTAIRAFLAQTDTELGGFYTVRSADVFPDAVSVHMLRAGGGDAPSAENVLFRCGRRGDASIPARFDRLGCAALADAGSAELLIMDELGPGEADAVSFQKAVFRALEGRTPVLGVLQRAKSPFLDEIKRSSRTYVIEVTPENRDLIPARIRDWHRLEWAAAPERAECADSYGAVVFDTDERGAAVLMVRSLAGWSFPKGHGMLGEPPRDTAAREIYEETGIRADIDTRFRQTVPSIKPGDRRSVTFFCGTSIEGRKQPIPLEVPDAAWVPIEAAEAHIAIAPDKKVFLRARAYYFGTRPADTDRWEETI